MAATIGPCDNFAGRVAAANSFQRRKFAVKPLQSWNDSRAAKVNTKPHVTGGGVRDMAGFPGRGLARQLFLTAELCEFAIRLAAVHTLRLISANKKG